MNSLNSTVRDLSPSRESVLALARNDLAVYTMANYPAFQLPPHLELVVSTLEAIERGELRRVCLSVPPRHGKSLLASHHFPAWYLGRHPDRYVIAASYGQDLADDFGRRVRNTVQAPLHRAIFPESKVTDDSAAIHRFNLTADGSYFAVGRGAAITGRGAHLLLIDDLLKDWEEASSPTIRRGLHEWFGSTAFTRLQPDGAVLVIATRWNDDDLCGFLLREHADEGWISINLAAIAEVNDPLGRAEGEALWPERYPLQVLESIRRQIGFAMFGALYQGHPTPPSGGLFKVSWWQRYAEPPTEFRRLVIAADTASKTSTASDYSAIVVIGETSTGYYVLYVWRGRVEFAELKKKLVELAAAWNPTEVIIEDASSGIAVIQELQRETNLPVIPVKADRDKVSRAIAVSPLVESGRVFLPIAAGWLPSFEEEIAVFPNGQHDDEVDAFVHGINRLAHSPIPGWGVVTFYDARIEAWSTATLVIRPKSGSPIGCTRYVRITGRVVAGILGAGRMERTLTIDRDTRIKIKPDMYTVHVLDGENGSEVSTVGVTVSEGEEAFVEV